MTSAHAPVPISNLLAHREWVRRLARSLVHDDASADDLEQRTWLRVLRSPPGELRSARAWLGRVVRNQAHNARRDAARRAGYERAAGAERVGRSAADVAAAAETHKLLVDAVLSLDEPYRTTVLLRFFEDLPPRAISRQMNVPVETVRTRVRRALEQLRDRLARGNASASWIAALTPIVGSRLDIGLASGASSASTAAVTGGTIMASKGTIAAAVGLGLAAGLVGGAFSGSMASSPDGANVDELLARIDALESGEVAIDDGENGAENGTDAHGPRTFAAVSRRQKEQDRRIETLEADLAAAYRIIAATGDGTDGGGGLRSATSPETANAGAAGAHASPRRGARNGVELSDDQLRENMRAYDDDRLMAEMQRLTKLAGTMSSLERRKTAGRQAIVAADLLLERPIEVDHMAEAYLSKAEGHRALEDDDAQRRWLNEAINIGGKDSPGGIKGLIRLGYAAMRAGDKDTAIAFYLESSAQPSGTAHDRSWGHYIAGNMLAGMGEPARAEAEYRHVVDTFSGSEDPIGRRNAQLCREALERLQKLERDEDR